MNIAIVRLVCVLITIWIGVDCGVAIPWPCGLQLTELLSYFLDLSRCFFDEGCQHSLTDIAFDLMRLIMRVAICIKAHWDTELVVHMCCFTD
jgi:hypothetical protein